MERKSNSRPSVKQLPEIPHINGSKPAEPLKIDEQCKKHIRKDGKR